MGLCMSNLSNILLPDSTLCMLLFLCLVSVTNSLFIPAGFLTAMLDILQEGTFLILEVVNQKKKKKDSSPGPFFSDHFPWNSSNSEHKQVKVCSQKVQGCDPDTCFYPSSQDPRLHNLVNLAAVNSVLDLPVPAQFFVIGMRSSKASPSYQLHNHLC